MTTTFQYRVTKYDPRCYGGPGGAYTRDEWTSYSDIGRSFDGVVLTRDEYERVEKLYLWAVRIAAQTSGVDRLQVRNLEVHGDFPVVTNLSEGQWVDLPVAVEVCRQMLREEAVWCTLESGTRCYVHIGYDYYMYIGTNVELRSLWASLQEETLFVEPGWPSPFLDR